MSKTAFVSTPKQDGTKENNNDSCFKEFCSKTTAHGFSYLDTPSKSVRTCWFVIIIFAFAAGTVHLHAIICEYLQYNYHENVVTSATAYPVFPDVTICDNSGLSEASIAAYNGSIPIAVKLGHFYVQKMLSEMALQGYLRLNDARIRALSSFAYSNIDRRQQSSVGVQYGDLVVDCYYKGTTCTEAHFKRYLHPSFINCFTFQADLTNITGQQLDGPHNGLTLILRSVPTMNLMYERLDVTQNVDTVKVAIHAPGTVPFMTKKSLDLEAGKSTSISLAAKTYECLGSPYLECKKETCFELDSRTFKATRDVCREKCMIEEIQKMCNCTSTMFEDLTRFNYPYCTNIDNVTPVEFEQRSECEFGVAKGIDSVDCDHCIWDCEQYNFDIQTAFSQWPHESKIDNFIQYHVLQQYDNLDRHERPCSDPVKSFYALLLNKSNINYQICPENEYKDSEYAFSFMTLSNMMRNLPPESDSEVEANKIFVEYLTTPGFPEKFEYVMDVPQSYYGVKTLKELNAKWVKESFYRVNIYFHQTSVMQHLQVASFSFADLWSSVGGILGLWAGFSVMTIIEIWSFIIKCIYNNCSRCNKQPNAIMADNEGTRRIWVRSASLPTTVYSENTCQAERWKMAMRPIYESRNSYDKGCPHVLE